MDTWTPSFITSANASRSATSTQARPAAIPRRRSSGTLERAEAPLHMAPPEHHPPKDDEYESVEDKMLRVRKFRDLADRFLKFVSDWDKGHHAKAASG